MSCNKIHDNNISSGLLPFYFIFVLQATEENRTLLNNRIGIGINRTYFYNLHDVFAERDTIFLFKKFVTAFFIVTTASLLLQD